LVETARRTEAGPVVDPAAFIERLRPGDKGQSGAFLKKLNLPVD